MKAAENQHGDLTMAATPTVFLIDDEKLTLRALERVFLSADYAVQSWSSAAEFLENHDPALPGCLVTDLAMPGMSGLELLSALQSSEPQRFVVLITGRGDIPTTVKAMKAGAVSFLPKPARREELLAAVDEALLKDSAARALHRERVEVASRVQTLTPRELEVLKLVAAGLLNKQIAAELGAAEKTIKVHRGRLMEKMNVRSAAALVNLLARFPHLVEYEVNS